MVIKTVGELINKLKQFDESMELDIDVSWYDKSNYNHAHRDRWDNPNNGIELCVTEESGIVIISNEKPENIYVYD